MYYKDSNFEKTECRTDNQETVRSLVIMGLQQVAEGKTKDFNSVCDRLEEQEFFEVIAQGKF